MTFNKLARLNEETFTSCFAPAKEIPQATLVVQLRVDTQI